MSPKTVIAKAKKKPIKKTKKASKKVTSFKFYEGVGRRKTAIARVRISPGNSVFMVNEKDFKQYFTGQSLQQVASAGLVVLDNSKTLDVEARVKGGGIVAQAEAVRLGISRALVKLNPENLKKLRGLGYLTRDPRMRERKKFGLKRARRAPQWRKR